MESQDDSRLYDDIRLYILFVVQFLGCYLSNVRKDKLGIVENCLKLIILCYSFG